MRIRRWWLVDGLALALLGGAARHTPVHVAENIQKPGHGTLAQAGYAIGGVRGNISRDRPIDGSSG